LQRGIQEQWITGYTSDALAPIKFGIGKKG
jgi:hypothetical protein